MTDKKNIERLFQEKFKDFEVNPTPEAWENIVSKLEKKENKKRVFPFWFNAKAAGIAAALVLGFFGLNNYSSMFTDFNSNSDRFKNETKVVQENNDNDTSSRSQNLPTTSTKNTFEKVSTKSENTIATVNNSEINNIKNDKSKNSIENNKENDTYPYATSASRYNNTKLTTSKKIKPSVKYFHNSNQVFVSNNKKTKNKFN